MSTTQPDQRVTTHQPVVATTEFAALFPIFDNDDIAVLHNGEPRTDFTVTATYSDGVSNDAKVHFATGLIGKVMIVGERAPRRQNRFGPGPLPVRDMNLAFDTVQGEMQEARRDIDRSIKSPQGNDGYEIESGSPGSFLIYGPNGNIIPTGAPMGAGNMNTAVYDPQNIAADAFAFDNMTGTIDPDQLDAGSITTEKLSDSSVTLEKLGPSAKATGSIRMAHNGAGAWVVYNALGVVVDTSASTTNGLQEALTAAKAGSCGLHVIGPGVINASTPLTIPSMFFGNIHIAEDVTIQAGALGSATVLTIDSFENSTYQLLGQIVQATGDTGHVVEIKPSTAVPNTGNTGAFASTVNFGTIVPAANGASALHLDNTNGSIIGIRCNIVDINGGKAGLKADPVATKALQHCQFTGQYWHGMSEFGVRWGSSSASSALLRGNSFEIARIAPKAVTAVGFSTFGRNDIIEINAITAEEVPGGTNLAAGISWEAGASGNTALIGLTLIGAGAPMQNNSGGLSNVSQISGARLAGTIDATVIGGLSATDGTFANLASTEFNLKKTPAAFTVGTKTLSNGADSGTNFGKYFAMKLNGVTVYVPCSTVQPT